MPLPAVASREALRNSLKKRSNNMARYADGFVIPVPKKQLDAYMKISKKAGKVWKEYGAIANVSATTST
jgi:hypothetical protein